MGKSIQAEMRKLLEACEPYEEYRRSLLMVYWNLLIVCGLENSKPLGNIMEWKIEQFRQRSKNEQKSILLLHELEAMCAGYWQKCRHVIGEEQAMKEVKPVLEFAAKTEFESQQATKKQLQILQDFFHNGYEKIRKDVEDVAKKTSDLEDLFATDPKKKGAFEKSLAKFKEFTEKTYKYVNPIDQIQTEHMTAIRTVYKNLENLNESLTLVYAAFETLPKKKFGHDQGKMARVAKEEKKRAALQASDF